MSEDDSPPRRRNLTITVAEDVARWARVRAAEGDTSVAQFVGDMLAERMREERRYEQARQEHFALLQSVRFGRRSPRFPTRDELHERRRRS